MVEEKPPAVVPAEDVDLDEDEEEEEMDSYPLIDEDSTRNKTFAQKIDKENPDTFFDPVDDLSGMSRGLLVHQFALGPEAKEKCIVTTTVRDDTGHEIEIVVCTLNPGVVDQYHTAISFEQVVAFTLHSGDGPVYILGTTMVVEDQLSTFDESDDEEIDSDEYGEEEMTEAQLEAIFTTGKRKRGSDDADAEDATSPDAATLAKKVRSLAAAAAEEDDSSDDDEDDSDSDDEEDADYDVANGEPKVTELSSEDEDDDSDEEMTVAKGITKYRETVTEVKDLVANYNKCGGDWAMIMNYQGGGDENDIPRYKKIIAREQKSGKAKKFSKKETAKIVAALEATMEEEDLAGGASDGEDDSEEGESSDEENEEDKKFINDVESAEEDEDEEEEAQESDADSNGDAEDDDSDDDDSDGSASDEDEAAAGSNAALTKIRANLAKSPNVPKKKGKFAKFMKNTFKLEDEEAVEALWVEQQAAKKK